MSEKSIKILETITIILIIAFALVSYIVSNYILKNERKNIAIYKKGVKITQVDERRIDKNIDGIYMIGDKNSEYNIVEIKDKKICCIDANCPDGICVKHGALNDDIDNDMIICAPHGLIISYE